MEQSTYGSVIDKLLVFQTEMALDAGVANSQAGPLLDALTIESAFEGKTIRDPAMAECCISGLWLRHNYLDESHTISQGIETPEGSYWHGIMHRRETDFGNSKYWFRRVGEHSIFSKLFEKYPTQNFLYSAAAWDPYAFIDFCQECFEGHSSEAELALQVQQLEWELLFDFCYQNAIE